MNFKIKAIILLFLFFLGVFCLNACQNETDVIKSNSDIIASPAAAEPYINKNLSLYYSLSNYELKKFEPYSGCYAGAYILADRSIGFDMAQFELKTSAHSSYKYHLKLGEEFPAGWILNCRKDFKLPFIIIDAKNKETPFDYRLITEYAKKFGELNEPVLIGFYPEPAKNGYPAEIYKKFFEYARAEFNAYAPNTAFVFITNSEELYKIDNYFPNAQSVDWVGINIYMPIENNNIKNCSVSSLNYFYNKYQSKYPLMISSLGISNYSADNHTYYTNEASEEISNFYVMLKNKYPRIKAVYYMDFDASTLLNTENTNPNSFLITNNDNVTDSYKKSISDSYFKNSFTTEQDYSYPQKILFSKLAAEKNGNYYIPHYLSEILRLLNDKNYSIQIDSNQYDNLSELAKLNNLKIIKENFSIYITKNN